MCLILFAWKQDASHPLLVLANRDEYFTRPTLPLHRWDGSAIYAGKDLSAGGTWLGVHESGRWAALTNYRQPSQQNPNAPSRGKLTECYLTGEQHPADYLATVAQTAHRYNGFNLLVGDREQLFYFSNQENRIRELTPGIYGLSNHLLDTDWHKVTGGKIQLHQALQQQADDDSLFAIMQDRQPARTDQLPDTGVGEMMERVLSPRFIYAPNAQYGTRTTTLVRLTNSGVTMKELAYENGEPAGSPFSLAWQFG
ncbi:MAG TPA: NRDE family protein, partial [Pseudomonadales bacterium]|nr:NRDE family protein [Pseudomonadales bacterium]